MKIRILSAMLGLVWLAIAFLLAASIRKAYEWVAPQGAWGTFYADTLLAKPAAIRPFKELSGLYFGKPANGVPADGFSLRICGWLWAPEPCEYEFAALHDDGMRCYIDEKTIFDAWIQQRWPGTPARGKAWLSRGWHSIVLEFFDQEGLARFRVEWCGGPIPARTCIGGENLWKVRVPWRR